MSDIYGKQAQIFFLRSKETKEEKQLSNRYLIRPLKARKLLVKLLEGHKHFLKAINPTI